jgi:hypothetical protein
LADSQRGSDFNPKCPPRAGTLTQAEAIASRDGHRIEDLHVIEIGLRYLQDEITEREVPWRELVSYLLHMTDIGVGLNRGDLVANEPLTEKPQWQDEFWNLVGLAWGDDPEPAMNWFLQQAKKVAEERAARRAKAVGDAAHTLLKDDFERSTVVFARLNRELERALHTYQLLQARELE